MRIKLNKCYEDRENNIYDNKNIKTKHFEKRLYGNGIECHDICHLYITYEHIGYGNVFEECVEIEDIRYPNDNLTLIENNNQNSDDDLECDDDCENCKNKDKCDEQYSEPWFIGGYCKKLKDESIIITFGKNSKNEIDMFD